MKRAAALSILVSVTLLAVAVMAEAQQPGKIARIGFLDTSTPPASAFRLEAFWQEIRKLGWIEGKNITIQYRFAEGKNDRLPELAADLVRLKVDLIVVAATPAGLAAKRATATIPIVMANSGDPVADGLIASMARPEGNVTGLSGLGPELNTKRLEVLKDTVSNLTRVGLLRPAGGSDRQLKNLRSAAQALKLKLEEIETQRDAKSLESAFQTIKQKQVGAMMTTTATTFFTERKRIVELASKFRLPAEPPPLWLNRPTKANGALMRSSDYGVTWQQLAGGFPSPYESMVECIDFDPDEPDHVFVGTGGEGARYIKLEDGAGFSQRGSGR